MAHNMTKDGALCPPRRHRHPDQPPSPRQGIPQNLVIGASSSQMTLDWDPPADTGGSPIAHYHVQYQHVEYCRRRPLFGNWLPASPWESANSHFQTNRAG